MLITPRFRQPCVPEIIPHPTAIPVRNLARVRLATGELRAAATNRLLHERHCWGYSAASLDRRHALAEHKLPWSPTSAILHLSLCSIKSNDSFMHHPGKQMT